MKYIYEKPDSLTPNRNLRASFHAGIPGGNMLECMKKYE